MTLCNEHAHNLEAEPWRIFCPDCFARIGGETDAYNDWDSTSSTGWGGSHVHGSLTGDAASARGQAPEEAVFDAEDYAAFDALSDFDQKAGLDHGYDS